MPYKTKEDKAAYMREYRQRMTDQQKQHAYEKVKQRQKEIAQWFRDFKKTLGCNRCGENHWACLEFHHKDPKEKEFMLYQVVSNGWSKKKILKEVAKCEVLCANCHRKEHADNIGQHCV